MWKFQYVLNSCSITTNFWLCDCSFKLLPWCLCECLRCDGKNQRSLVLQRFILLVENRVCWRWKDILWVMKVFMYGGIGIVVFESVGLYV